MVKHGTYRLDAPPPFQGVWRAIVDRVHYRFNTVRVHLLACGECEEVYMRHLQDNEYAYSGCSYHRGVYSGFCPFAGTRYVFNDTTMRASRVQVPVHALQIMREAHERRKKDKEPKPHSLDIPFASSPMAMSSAESLDHESESARATDEPFPASSESSYSIPTESDANGDPAPDPEATPVLRTVDLGANLHSEHADSTDSLPKSPFSDDESVPRPTTPSSEDKVAPRTSEHQASEEDINPFILASNAPVANNLGDIHPDHRGATTPAGDSLTTQHAPDMLELLHAAADHASTQARALADLRAALAILESQLVAEQERRHTLVVTVRQQAHKITSLEAQVARDDEKIQRLREERRRLLQHRERMFEAFGLHDPEKWDADD